MMRARHSIDRIPFHLRPYIVEQSQEDYTPIDHAAWRYIMRVSRAFFRDHAHEKYLDGLVETGIETERIPRIDEMDLCLSQFGWGAVPVSGFIPPSVFMELMALGILPIAAEMRVLEHLDYTPSPDIVHEAAGHGPILADPMYAEFLHGCGDIAKHCILTKKDMAQYDAIKLLSDLKEDPRSTPAQIESAQEALKLATAANTYISEATQFARFMWWTAEYGLIGSLEDPKIYGAGLLSSVSESFHCLSENVRKLPLTVKCVEQGYDITEPQPQLFVTPDFEHLLKIVNELGSSFAFKTGGQPGLNKAVECEYVTTIVLDSGLQISGVLSKYVAGAKNTADFLRFSGPVQLCFENAELPGQGIQTHAQGYSSPLGAVVVTSKHAKVPKKPMMLHEISIEDLSILGLAPGQEVELKFVNSDYLLRGKVTSLTGAPRDVVNRPLVITFADCSVWDESMQLIYDPSWGSFDLACGSGIVSSVFGGAADRPQYQTNLPAQQKAKTLGLHKDAKAKALCELYAKVRRMREDRAAIKPELIEQEMQSIHAQLQKNYPHDWLLRLELLELQSLLGLDDSGGENLRAELRDIAKTKKSVEELIGRGTALLGEERDGQLERRDQRS